MSSPPKPPYLGAAYYPEAWPEGTIEQDIQRAKELGINCFRIAEFAWSRMERREGEYDFQWLHNVCDRLLEAEIAVMMGTPTPTPPAWLTRKYPEVLAHSADGRPYGHGGRRHGCPTSPKFRELCRGIATKMAEEFAADPAIVSWQIDNEYGCHISQCFCENCLKGWHEWLQRRYETLDALNEAWGTELWSQYYTEWEEIPQPVQAGAMHHPSLLHHYRWFMSDMYAEQCREQYEILKEAGAVNVTTDGMPNAYHRLDYEEMFRDLDLVANNCYFPPSDYAAMIAECDWMRPLKDQPYYFTESATGWTGGGCVASLYLGSPGSIRARGWFMNALGGEAVMYWLWRGHWSGQEMNHGCVIHPWGEPTPGSEEIAQLSAELEQAGEFLRQTKVPQAPVGIHFHTPSGWILDHEPQVPGFHYDTFLNRHFHAPLLEMNVMRDVLFAGQSLEGYQLLLTPFMAWLPDETLEKVLEAVAAGMTWVVGPLTSIRSEHGTRYRDCALGALERSLPFRVVKSFPATGVDPDIVWADTCTQGKATVWCDVLEAEGPLVKPLAVYESGPAAGEVGAIEIAHGQGTIKVLGFLPGDLEDPWLRTALWAAGVQPVCPSTPGVAVVPRVGQGTHGWVAFDWKGEGGHAVLPEGGIDLITGDLVPGVLSLEPYGVAVVECKE
jgi:beta-galactosidase GanA